MSGAENEPELSSMAPGLDWLYEITCEANGRVTQVWCDDDLTQIAEGSHGVTVAQIPVDGDQSEGRYVFVGRTQLPALREAIDRVLAAEEPGAEPLRSNCL